MVSILARSGATRRPGHALITRPGRWARSGIPAIAGVIVLIGVFLFVVFGLHRSARTSSESPASADLGTPAWQADTGPAMSFAPSTALSTPTRENTRGSALDFTDPRPATGSASASRSRSAAHSSTSPAPTSQAKSDHAATRRTSLTERPSASPSARAGAAGGSAAARKTNTSNRIPAQNRDVNGGGGLGGAVKALVPAL